MRPSALMAAASAVFLASGCQTLVYHVAEKAEGDGIYVLHRSGSDPSAGPTYAGGRYPHVAADGSLLYVKQGQVFRGASPLTSDAAAGSRLAAAPDAYAYVQTTSGQSPRIVVRSYAGAAQLQFASDASGLAFYDNGSKLLYAQRDGIFSTPASGTHVPTKVADCLTNPPAGCGPLAVSHDGRYFAYYTYVQLAPVRIEYIQVARIGSWQPLLRIAPRDFCPTCAAGAPDTPEQLGSFDFAPDDGYLYATVRVAGPGTGADARKRDELFRVKLDLAASTPTVSAPQRLTRNTHPDFHPSTRKTWRFW
jgi:hypothetical protein